MSTFPHGVSLTTLIIGGGIAGLWLCDSLRRRGDPVLLLESRALGAGQTIASQGIVHGGVKYALAGAMSESAANIGEMPARWRACLAGTAEPDLGAASLRATHCHLWQTAGLRSTLGMLGARLALEVTPEMLAPADRPDALRSCAGTVSRLEEPVVDVASVLSALARRNAGHLLQVAAEGGVAFRRADGGRVREAVLTAPDHADQRVVAVTSVVLAAGAGNAALREKAGLPSGEMQRRPLHMVMVRGKLPMLNGHCVDGARTRVTISTVQDHQDRTVWLVGGQVAEAGVGLDEEELVRHAGRELEAVLPGVVPPDVDWGTYRIDRAERATAGGGRPDDVQILQEGNVITVWPTKLALAPRLADRLLDMIPRTGATAPLPADWPAPSVATPPWDQEAEWTAAR